MKNVRSRIICLMVAVIIAIVPALAIAGPQNAPAKSTSKATVASSALSAPASTVAKTNAQSAWLGISGWGWGAIILGLGAAGGLLGYGLSDGGDDGLTTNPSAAAHH